jgi:hypothetical protein
VNVRRITLAFFGALVAPILARGALPDGLVAAWSLSESSNGTAAVSRADLLGNYTLTDNNTTPSGAGLVYPNSADFETGNSEFLSNADFGFGGSITVAAWVNFESFPSNPVIVAKDIDTPANSRDWTLDWNANILRFYVSGGNQGFASVSLPNTNINDWHFVVGWFDDTANTSNIQLDNGTVQTLNFVTNQRHNSDDAELRIGARQYAGFQGYFDGRIGPVFIWNRVLTSSERTQLYNNQNGFPLPWSVGFHGKQLHSPIFEGRTIQ